MSARSFHPRLPHAAAPPYGANHSPSQCRRARLQLRDHRGRLSPLSLETIIVTATRRELSVQDIPLNIAAFDDSLLEAREISDLAELGRNVPGLYVIDQGKRSSTTSSCAAQPERVSSPPSSSATRAVTRSRRTSARCRCTST